VEYFIHRVATPVRNSVALNKKGATITVTPMTDRSHQMPPQATTPSASNSGTCTSKHGAVNRWITLALAALLLWPAQAFSQVFISEFLADNQVNSLVDEDGDHSDWIEIWNSGAAPVSLNGWYLTDSTGDLRQWRFPVTTPSVTVAAGGRLVVFASGKDRKVLANRLHTNFKLSKNAGSDLLLVRPDGLTIEHQYMNYPQQVQDIAYGLPTQSEFQPLVAPGTAGKAKVPLSAADMPAGWNGNGAFDDSAWQPGNAGFGYDTAGTYGDLIGPGGDLQAAMHTVNSTALVRIPFTVSNLSTILSLRLSMKYDDGYVCYLNGVQIASANAPAPPQWNSGASLDRNGALTSTYEVVSPATAHTLLVAGTNMLAIQLLNFSNGTTQDVDNQGTPNGSRTLALPLLEANVNVGFGVATYLQTATPNANNSAPRASVGPLISGTTNTAIRPAGGVGSAPIVITTNVVPSLRPLATTNPVLLRYRIQYSAEQIVNMRDDGVSPDLVASDGTYSGLLPTTALGPGQMLRWRVSATDNNTVPAVSTDPPFLDITDNDQFYGTVALDAPSQGIENSQLPILHWFVQDANASRTEGGTRCSFFYLGRFYDNVHVNLHGQSSSGFPTNKKSHDVNFNEDNRFVWKNGEPAQRAINLLTNYADKTKVRNTLGWESWATASHIASHYSFPVRVQQNGAFWGVYDMVENGDEDFLERCGLDVNGAFYKVYNSLENSTGVEKKTRQFEGNNDLQAMITALDTALPLLNRRRYSYDNVDVPSLVNFLANNIVILNNDSGHKNYYVYRDTNGTREWSVLPWDQDLSLGHTWTSTQNYFNDDIHTMKNSNAATELLVGAAGGNRLMNLVTNTNSGTVAPEMLRMFLARLRTLMDKDLVSATETNGPWEQRINEIVDLIDPPGAAFLTDGDRDLQQWGYWLDGSGSPLSGAGQDAAVHDHGLRKQALRLLNANPNPPYPASANNAEGLFNTIPPYLPGRRARLFNGGLTLLGAPIPPSQPAVPTNIVIETVDFNPGNQDQEYFIIRNNSASYVDISDWKITGAVEYTFRGGTVIPPFTSGQPVTATGDVHNGRLHVARNSFGFRNRAVSPKMNEFRLVVGGYKGQLSARGETINLVKPGAMPAEDVVIATNTYTGNPTATQNFLRITELNYNPAAPTVGELATLPGIEASEFEFIELTNTDSVPLNLGGAFFDKGITFTFPANFTLQPGQRCVVAALIAAYDLRYAGSGAIVAGQFEGNLANGGETIQLLDVSGEQILEFEYDPDWYGVPDNTAGDGVSPVQGYSLVTRSQAPEWNTYNDAVTWALGGAPGGTPGTNDTTFTNVYLGWVHDHFTPAEQDAGLSVPGGDVDIDERGNFAEYSFGGNPRSAESAPILSRQVVSIDGVNYPAVRFAARRAALDINWLVEASTDGTVWRTLGANLLSRVPVDASLDEITVRDSEPAIAGSRIFRVRAQYVGSTFETAPLTIENHAPAAIADVAATHNTAVTIPVLANDTDSDTDTLTVRSLNAANRGTAVLNGDGTVTFTPDGTFGPSGGGSFNYVVGDNFGGETQGVVTVNVANQVPAATADAASAHAATVTINVLSNDTDPDSDTLSVSGVTQGAHGTVAVNGSNVTYSPAPSFQGAGSDTFSYTAADGYGGTANGTVTVTLTNSMPVAATDNLGIRHGAFAVPVLANDTDGDSDTLSVVSVTQGTHGTVTLDSGIVTYTLTGAFTGSESFTYTVSDGFGGTSIGTVNLTNTAPQAVNDTHRVSGGAAVLVPVIANDTDPDEGQTFTVSTASNPASGTIAVEGTSIRYTPDSTFDGTDAFTYSIDDGFGGTSTATVNIVDELLAGIPGTYQGLVGGDTQDKVGISKIQLSTKGRFTGQVWYLGEKHTVAKKQFDTAGAATFTIATKTGKSRTLALQLDSIEDGMTGQLTDGATTYEVKLKRTPKVFTKTNPCPQEGAYTALLPPAAASVGDPAYPQGFGSGTMKISKTGALTSTAILGDGKKAVIKSSVNADGTALLHAPLYTKPKGFICGEIEFVTGDAEADARGDLTWRKLSQLVPDETYPTGFSGTTEFMAARYTRPASGVPIFGSGISSATATLEYGGLIQSPTQKTASILPNAIQIPAQGTDALTLTVNRTTGVFTGKYAHPRDLKKRPLSGVLYQKQTISRGMFKGVNESGQTVTGSWMLAP
jgi:hypothetical protein